VLQLMNPAPKALLAPAPFRPFGDEAIVTHLVFRRVSWSAEGEQVVPLHQAAAFFRDHQSWAVGYAVVDHSNTTTACLGRSFRTFAKQWMYWDGKDWNLAYVGFGADGYSGDHWIPDPTWKSKVRSTQQR
jgi:hypothetical protein